GANGTRAAMSLYWRGTYEIRTMALALPSRDLSPVTDSVEAELARPAVAEKETVTVSDGASFASDGASSASGGASSTSGRASSASGGASSTSGGASSAPTTEKAYVPRLSLAQIGSPYLSAGGGAFGSFVRAGISMGFGDMLGEQELDTAIQVG